MHLNVESLYLWIKCIEKRQELYHTDTVWKLTGQRREISKCVKLIYDSEMQRDILFRKR